MNFALTAPTFDVDDLFWVILEQSSPISFADWTYTHASWPSCTDGISSYTYTVELGAATSTHLNDSWTTNATGNSIVWDKLNSVPVASNPHVIIMSSSNQTIINNIYTVTVTVKPIFNCGVTDSKAFTVKIKQACRFAALTAKWDINNTASLVSDYKIGSTALTFVYSITTDMAWCSIQEQIQYYDGTSWLAYTGPDITISPARTFRIYSTNGALDPSLVAPTKQFRM